MSTERQELANYINDVLLHKAWEESGEEVAVKIVDVFGYRKPRTITTDEEMDALPALTVVLDADKFPHEKQADGEGGYFWVMTGDEEEYAGIALPATVIWEPQS